MSQWVVAGTSSDLSQDVEDYVRDLIKNNWSLMSPDPAASEITFGTDWWSDYGDYQIHCKHLVTLTGPQNNGWSMRQYLSTINIHVFVRKNSEDKPTQLGVISREIERILAMNPTTVGAGISNIKLVRAEDVPDNEPSRQVWHRIMQAELQYWKVRTS
jgi:hypothetical protein